MSPLCIIAERTETTVATVHKYGLVRPRRGLRPLLVAGITAVSKRRAGGHTLSCNNVGGLHTWKVTRRCKVAISSWE